MARAGITGQEWREGARARVEEAHGLLVEQVEAIQSGEEWQAYLGFQARLHAYSPGNVLLICAQHARAYAEGRVPTPEPSYVAGFVTWKAVGRSVDKGRHGYAILAPVRRDRRVAVDGEGQVRPLGRYDAPESGEVVERRQALAGFRVEHVFELNMTSGAPVPEPSRPKLLEGEAPAGLGAAVLALVEARGYRVDTAPSASFIQGANAQVNWGSRTVLVRADMDDASMVKSLIHEAAHVVLHEGPPGATFKEVEGESVAFLVARAHGMATQEYSFPYVAAWAGPAGAKVVLATQDRVLGAARAIIEASPAPHSGGGRVPGAEAGVAAARAPMAAPGPQLPEGPQVPEPGPEPEPQPVEVA
ncbi:MAG: ArdC-like ssDNA-binding domain-containing protein [Acidimicrobiales bacterium]